MERVRGGRAVSGGIGERADDLELLDDRAGPPVRDDQRQRVLVPGADVDEVNVQPVDLGDEVGQRVQLLLALAPVVVCRPVAREVLHHLQPRALRVVGNRLALGPPGRVHAPAQLGEVRLRKTDLKRADSNLVAAGLLCVLRHVRAPSSSWTRHRLPGTDADAPTASTVAPTACGSRPCRSLALPWGSTGITCWRSRAC